MSCAAVHLDKAVAHGWNFLYNAMHAPHRAYENHTKLVRKGIIKEPIRMQFWALEFFFSTSYLRLIYLSCAVMYESYGDRDRDIEEVEETRLLNTRLNYKKPSSDNSDGIHCVLTKTIAIV